MIIIGNEYGAADFQPHLIYGLTLHAKIAADAAANTETTVVSGGHHPKMRLRQAYQMVVDTALTTTKSKIDVLHGASAVVNDHESPAVDSAVGVMDDMTIVDQYKDVAAADGVFIKLITASSTGDLFFTLEYELVE